MDDPQYQVFREDNPAYRYTKYPFRKQHLQLLYPGRLLTQEYHYTGENIPNENPEGLLKTKTHDAALAKAASMEQEALARHLGGKDKVVRHPAVEPEAVLEDPKLTSLTLGDTAGLNPNLDKVPSKYDNLRGIEEENVAIVDRVREDEERKNFRSEKTSATVPVPPYDWKEDAGVEAYDGKVPQEPVCKNTKSSPNMMLWFVLGIFAIVLIAFLVCIFQI
uniref:Uncharacterized protein n=1 Tax=Marseillevirus LCMAC102 TaxID=2506603 RepID=A0A481YUN8_9VIRU|nr:MAG: hypothetical protein LCMAC102_00100 [Marseillevirus LCMAC102]